MNKVIDILLVEDNPGDVRLIEEAFKTLTVRYQLHVAIDGVEALLFLHKDGKYKDSPEPQIVFLDLNLPKKNGYEVLADVKNNNQLKHIPIIILSTSDKDITNAYNCYANSYLRKPVDFDKFVDMVKAIEAFWFKNAELPA